MTTDLSTSTLTSLWEKLSFLAPPERVTDWRKALLFDVAAEAGILAALPAAPAEVAAGLGLVSVAHAQGRLLASDHRASGKSTLAAVLARELRLPLVARRPRSRLQSEADSL